MLWNKEVEIAKSIDELVTSRSITGQPKFPDFDMLDAMKASALRKLPSQHAVKFPEKSKCRRAASSEFRPILTRKTNCELNEYFRTNGAYEAVQGLSTLFALSLQNDDVQDFDV